MESTQPLCVLGRYVVYDVIASGGMASVHFGRMLGAAGFARTVAIKRLHPHHARDPEFVAMFVDEARLAARVHHPNVVSTLDVVEGDGELFLVMEYVAGESLARLITAAIRNEERIPPAIVSSIITQALHGLHAAHEATSESGAPLGIVHRDISPQNIIVGGDGVARVLDFGVAKAGWRLQTTRDGQMKGKLAYMAPEQFGDGELDHRGDVYAMGCVLWETLSQRRLFGGDVPGAVVHEILRGEVEPASRYASIPAAVDFIVSRALSRSPNDRFPTALDMAEALEAVLPPAPQGEVRAWVASLAQSALEERARRVAQIERLPPSGAMLGTRDLGLRSERARADTVRFGDDEPAHVVAPTPLTQKKRSSFLLVAMLAMLATVLVGVATLKLVRAREGLHPSTDGQPLEHLATMPSAVAESSAGSAGAAEPSAGTPARQDKGESSIAPAASSAKAQVPRRTPRGAQCDPPFTIDEHNIKRFKQQCL